MGRHGGVLVAHARHGAAVGRVVHQYFGDGGAGGLGLGDVHELALAGAQPVHQGGHDGEDRVLAGGVVGIGYLGHHRRPAEVAGLVGQTRRTFGGRAGGAEVGPRPVEPVAGGRHHDDVRLYFAEVLVFQTEVLDHPGGEILGENVGNGDQLAKNPEALRFAQVQGDAQFVAVLLVEIGALVPELAGDVVLIDRVAAVALQPAGGLQADDLGAHVGQQFHGKGDGDELAHLDDPDAFQWGGHALLTLHY